MRTTMLIILAATGFSSGVALAQSNGSMPPPTSPATEQPNPLGGFPAREHRGGGRHFAALQAACGSDFATLCPGMHPGDGQFGQCVRANRTKLSKGCGDAMTAMRAARVQRRMPATAAPATPQ